MKLSHGLDKFIIWGSNYYSSRTLDLYVLEIRKIIKHTKDKEIENLSVFDDLIHYSETLRKQGRKDNTVNFAMISLRQYWSFLEDVLVGEVEGLKLPFKKRAIPFKRGVKAQSHKPLTAKEWHDLQKAFKRDTFVNLRNETMIRLLYATGMRVSELTSLEIRSVNQEAQEITTITRKERRGSQSERVIPYTADVYDVMSIYLDVRTKLNHNEALFINMRDMTRITPRSVQRILKNLCKEAGIKEKRTPHSMRHGMGMRMYNAGMHPADAQVIFGHSSIHSSQPYRNIQTQRVKDEYHRRVGDNVAQKREG